MKSKEFKIHSVKYNFVMNTILRMSSFLFPLITFPYVSRVLGVALNGKIAFSTSYVRYFTLFAQLGIPTYGIRACASVRNDRKAMSKLVQELLIINSIMVVLCYGALLITVFTIPKIIENRPLILISSVSVILSCIGIEWFYQAIEQYDYITFRNIAFKFLSVILMFLLVHKPQDYIIYAGINVLGTVGSNILNFIRVRKYVSLRFVTHLDLRQHLRPIFVFFMFTVSATVYTSMDAVMLGFMSSDEQVGLYAAAIKMRNILYHLVTSIGTVLLPRASYLIRNNKKTEYQNIIRTTIQFVAALAVPLTVYFVLEARDSILFLSGDQYAGASLAMMIVTPTVFLAGISNITGIQVLIPLDLEKYTVTSTFGGALTDLVLNAIFIPKYGAAGAAFGTLVAEVVVLVIQLAFIHKNRLDEYVPVEWKNTAKIFVAGVVPGIIVFIVMRFITLSSYFEKLVISALVYFGVYALLLAVFKERIFWDYGIRLALKAKKRLLHR